MKKIILFICCAMICTEAFSQSPAPCYRLTPEWEKVTNLKEKVQRSKSLLQDKKDELLRRYKELKEIYEDSFYYGTNEWCKEYDEFQRQVELYGKDVDSYEADVNNFKTAGCASQHSEAQHASCVVWHSKLVKWKSALDTWFESGEAMEKQLRQKGARIDAESASRYGEFIKDAEEALTVIKTYHLTAKTWINNEAISEFSFDGFVIKRIDWSRNTPPTSSDWNPDIDDYKLYQSFDIEVRFIDGKVVSAKFNRESLECRGGKSMCLEGLVYIKEQKTSALGKESVTFTRTVAGHSKVLWAKEIFTGESPDIYNTISIDVFVDRVVTRGNASDFPTTYFWIDGEIFAKKSQVQPSDYFNRRQ